MAMTKEAFIADLKLRKGDDYLIVNDVDVFPCNCGEPNCKGWILDGKENREEGTE